MEPPHDKRFTLLHASRSHAYRVKEEKNNAYTEVASAFDRLAQILRTVLPYSELHVEILSDRLNQRVLAQNLNVAPLKSEVMEVVAVVEKCYCAGEKPKAVADVWGRLAKQLFSIEVRDAVREVYVAERKRLAKMRRGLILEKKVFADVKTAVQATLPSRVVPEKKPATRSAFSFDRPAEKKSAGGKPAGVEKNVESESATKKPEKADSVPAPVQAPPKMVPRPSAKTEKPSIEHSVSRSGAGTTIKVPNLETCPEVLQDGRVVKIGGTELEIPPEVVGAEFQVKYSRKRQELSLVWNVN